MRRSANLLTCLIVAGFATPAVAQEVVREIPYERLTPAEITLAKRLGRNARYQELTFCADPGNPPLSTRDRDGYLNRIAEIVAEELGARASYYWRPFYERGLTREPFRYGRCDILIDIPYGHEDVLTTEPIYRTTYVFVKRQDADFEIAGFDDEDLRTRRIGVYQTSAIRQVLARYGIKDVELLAVSRDADLVPEHQPWRLVEMVVNGRLDIAGVWGPFAGWRKVLGDPIELVPVNLWDDDVPLEFDLAFAVPRTHAVLKFALDYALLRREEDIRRILRDYGVPLVRCGRCVVDGDLPSHGPYRITDAAAYRARFLEPVDPSAFRPDPRLASPDQIVTVEEVARALAAGADLRTELARAVLASDLERVRFLLERGADPNAPDRQGFPPLVIAAQNRDTRMIRLLLEAGADVDATDRSGFTALHHAVLRNHVPTIELLVSRGADLGRKGGPAGLSPLALALSEGKRWAAAALIELGADVNERIGEFGVTPLMLLAAQDEAFARLKRVAGGPGVTELAAMLVERGADVDARSTEGMTALMIAAANDNGAMLGFLLSRNADPTIRNRRGETALDLARKYHRRGAEQALRLVAKATPTEGSREKKGEAGR